MGWWSKITGGGKRNSGKQDAPDGQAELLQNQPPEFHRFVAQCELDQKDNLQRGARHLARLLHFNPTDVEALQLVDAYLQACESDPMELFSQDDSQQLGCEDQVLQALVLARLGRLAEAVDLLVALVNADHDAVYLEAWVLNWLNAPGAVESLPAQTMLPLMLLVSQRYPEWKMVTADQKRQLDRYVALTRRWACSGDLAEVAQMTRIGLLRKAGRFPEALQAAQSFVREHPGWHAHISEALVLREMGEVEGALAAFERAIPCRPDDLAGRLEAADMFFEHQQWQDACQWYGHVLQAHPEHPWALPSSLYCQWKLTDDPKHLDPIWKLLNDEPTSRRAYQLYERCTPYLGFLPEPQGKTAEFLVQVLPQINGSEQQEGTAGTVPEFTLPLSHLEAPSTRLAFRLLTEHYDSRARLLVRVQHIPRPDPRKPCRPVKYLLWTYHETEPAPAVPVPPRDIVERVRQLASEPYDYQANWASASRAAAKVEATDAGSILAVMVHPPALPPGEDVLRWLPRVQLAAARLLAHLDGAWHTSLRRDALLSALWGPRDWTTIAAIIVMTQIARHDDSTATDIRDAFATLADHRPEDGFCCYEHALYSNWILLPCIPDKERRALEKELKRLEKTKQKRQ
jgi:tetratricopeptide (TPR) repeat protein